MNTINVRTYINPNMDANYPIWHPYSNIRKNYFQLPNMVKGKGVYLFDIHHKKYLDASSGLWNISLGYGNEKIEESIRNQMNELPFCSLFENTNPTAIKAATEILEILPSAMKKIFFTCSGSESVELAIKVMREFWFLNGHPQKNIILAHHDSYHGAYYGSISASGCEQPFIKPYGPMLPNMFFFHGGICAGCSGKQNYPNCDLNCAGEIENFIKNNHHQIAGIIIEPILASKGVFPLSEKYLNYLGRLCNKYDLLMTVDEVAVGFYRTGTAFYIEKFQLQPDIICLGKGINSGYLPLGATSFNQRICETFYQYDNVLIHGSTQGGNLLACAACVAAIEQYHELNVAENVRMMGIYLKQRLERKLIAHRNIKEIRGEGLLLEIELVKSKASQENLAVEQVFMVQEYLRRNGLIVYRSDIGLTLLPMLIINQTELDFMINTIEETFNHILY